MGSGSLSPPAPGPMKVVLIPPLANGEVTARITAVEDDSDSPFDDDSAHAGGFGGFPLEFPAGEGKEATVLVIGLDSSATGGDDELIFAAQIICWVEYV